ncbi:MAG: prepilin-type cleavage/methylation protein [Massilia sp.]|nr:prepilin-type cleavage/methylation protein [Massilia sp.]
MELAVGAVLAALLAGMLLERLIAYQGETESVAAKQLIGTLRTALAMRSAEEITRGGDAALMTLAHQNPMRWLQRTLENYLGEYCSAPKEGLPSGHWYFDRSAETLV